MSDERSIGYLKTERGWIARLGDPPPVGCMAIAPGTTGRPEELTIGRWIVLCAAIWSGPDLMAMRGAVTVPEKLDGRAHLAVLAIDYYDETARFCPQVQDPNRSPLWLFLVGGRLAHEEVGLKSTSQLEKAARRIFRLD